MAPKRAKSKSALRTKQRVRKQRVKNRAPDKKSRTEIAENIRRGLYKLKIDRTRKGPVWQIFAMVTKENGSVVDGCVSCIKCKKLYHSRTSQLLERHSCVVALMQKQEGEGKVDVDDIEEEECDDLSKKSTESLFIEPELNPGCDTEFRKTFEAKLKAGHYRLVESTTGRSPLWSLFAKISKENGTIFDDRVYCRQCKRVLRYDGITASNLYRHNCFLLMRHELSETSTKKTLLSVADLKEDVKAKLKTDHYKLMPKSKSKKVKWIWTVMAKIAKEDGSTLREWVCCRHCRNIIKYNGKTSHFYHHKCYIQLKASAARPETPMENGESSPDPGPEMDVRQILKSKLESGQYRLNKKSASKSVIWSLYDQIVTEDGTLLGEWICCRKCKNVFKYTSNCRANVYRHRCYFTLPLKSQKPYQGYEVEVVSNCTYKDTNQKNIESKIRNGIYKLMDNQRATSSIFSAFDLIARTNGFILEGYVFCRPCKMVLKYDGKTADTLKQHKCGITKPMTTQIIIDDGETTRPARLSRAKEVADESQIPVINAVEEETDDPYSVCVKEEFMPNDFVPSFENIPCREEVQNKLQSGAYKLIEQLPNKKSPVWSVYAQISKEDGFELKGWVFCRKCENLFTFYRSQANFYRHRCYLEMLEKTNADQESEDENEERQTISNTEEEIHLNPKSVQSKIQSGFYKLTNNPLDSSIWSVFKLISKENGSILQGFVCCRQCKKVLKHEGNSVANLERHKCVTTALPTAMPMENENDRSQRTAEIPLPIREQVEMKLKSGRYKLIDKLKNKSPIWKLYAKIAKEDGSVLREWLYCRSCKTVLKFNGTSTANMYRHKCYLNREKSGQGGDEPVEETEMSNNLRNIKSKIQRGIYKLTNDRGSIGSMWSKFNGILKEDGSRLKGFVCCGQCKVPLKYGNLKRHKCCKSISLETIDGNKACPLDESQITVINAAEEETDDPHSNSEEEEFIASCQSTTQITVAEETHDDLHLICEKEEFIADCDSTTPPPPPPSVESNLRKEIKTKLQRGHYKIIDGSNKRSAIWSLYAQISTEDGSILEEWLYCRECTNVLKYNGKSKANFYHHKCYFKAKKSLPSKGRQKPGKDNNDIDPKIVESQITIEDVPKPIKINEEPARKEVAPVQLVIPGNSTNKCPRDDSPQITIKNEMETDDTFSDHIKEEIMEEFISIN